MRKVILMTMGITTERWREQERDRVPVRILVTSSPPKPHQRWIGNRRDRSVHGEHAQGMLEGRRGEERRMKYREGRM